MAKKKTIIEETIPDVPDTIDAPTQFAAWVKIKVYKIVPGLGQPQFCFSRTTDIDEEGLQASTFGGGRYEIHYCDADNKTVQVITHEIAAPAQPSQPLTPESIQIQMLREQSQMNRDLLMAVLGTGQNARTTPMSEIANMWSIMHGTMGGNGMSSMIELFKQGIEIGKLAIGGDDWKSALIGAGREVLPAVAAAVAAHGKQPIPPGMLPNVAPNGNGIPQPTVEIHPDMLIKTGLAYLKPRIRAGLPYDLALEWICTNANDPQYQPLVDFAMSKTFDDLVKIDPDVANEPYKTWFQNVFAGIKQHFDELAKNESE